MSNKKSENVSTGGIGFSGLLTIVFIVLKLCHVIDWSSDVCSSDLPQ